MIILTGASGGIGKEMLESLSELDDVIAIYNSSEPDPIKSTNRIIYHRMDICSESEIINFVNSHSSSLNKITLVHGAGVAESDLVLNHSRDMWETAVEVNLTANILLTKALLPYMIRQKWGRIVHFSSIRVSAGTLSYTTTKRALLGLSEVLSQEYAKFNITSNALILGAFDTGMFRKLKQKVKQELISQIPGKKLGCAEDITRAIEFIMNSPFVNGAQITIDGGASV